MYHSITFGDGALYPAGHPKEGQFRGTNTWEHWHLIPSSRPVIAPPGVSTNFVEIPGRSGAVDLTEYLTNSVVYGSRSGSFEFFVDNDHEDWETIRMKVMAFLHGQRWKICLEDDPRFYWEGRFSVNEWKSEPWRSRLVIDYVLDPYKHPVHNISQGLMIWDTFNFERDSDWYAALNNITLDGITRSFVLPWNGYPYALYAVLNSGNVAYITFGNVGTAIHETNHPTLVNRASRDGCILTISGSGNATIYFEEGSL